MATTTTTTTTTIRETNETPSIDIYGFQNSFRSKFNAVFSARCNIYISRLCYDVSVRLSARLSVTEVHWRIIANLDFKFFRSKFTAQPTMSPHALRVAVHASALWSRCMPGRGEGLSRATLATARPSCLTRHSDNGTYNPCPFGVSFISVPLRIVNFPVSGSSSNRLW